MTDRDIIHEYLKSLSKYLARLDKAEADEVIREIEGHIYDALDVSETEGGASTILKGFGSPRELAAGYVDHILEGSPPPTGFRAIKAVKKGATKGLYYSTGLLGYLFSAALMVVGIMKLFVPEMVGLWVASHGNSIAVGARSQLPEGAEEILGWWIVPFAIGAGLAIAYLTRRLLSILKDKL